MSGAVVVVLLSLLGMHVGLGLTHFKEVVVLSASEIIVPILAMDSSALLGLLDVPEHMVGDGVENLLFGVGSKGVLVSVGEIFGEVVLLTLGEDAELSGEDILEVFLLELSLVFMELSKELKFESVLVFLVGLPNFILGLEFLEFSSENFIVSEVVVLEVILSHSEENSSVSVTRSSSERVEHLLEERSLLIARSSLTESLVGMAVVVVLLHSLLVLKEILIFFLVVGHTLLHNWLMVSDMHVSHFEELLMLIGSVDISVDLSLDVLASFFVGVGSELHNVLLLEHFESKSVVPVAVESVHLLTLVPGWHRQLLSPEGSEAEFTRGILGSGPGVLDDLLVEKSSMEGPDVVLIHAVINGRGSTRRRVGVNRFSLDVVELKLLVCVFTRNNWRDTHNMLLIRLIFLETLILVSLVHGVIVHVTQERRVVLEALMPSQEGVVNDLISDCTCEHSEAGSGQVGDQEVSVLLHVVVKAGRVVCSSHALVDTVLMSSPHVIDALLDILVEGTSGHHGGNKKPEGHVECLKFEDGYTFRISERKATYVISW